MTLDINAHLANVNLESLSAAACTPIVDLKALPTVTNSGLYRIQLQGAFVRTGFGPDNTQRESIELSGIGTLESDPNHHGFIRLYVDIPTYAPGEWDSIKIRFHCLLAACKSFTANGKLFFNREERITKDGQNVFVVCPDLEHKTIYANVLAKTSANGRNYLTPYAFFDAQKRSPEEASKNLPAREFMDNSFKSEGKPLGPSINEQKGASANVRNAFSAPAAQSPYQPMQGTQFTAPQSAPNPYEGF